VRGEGEKRGQRGGGVRAYFFDRQGKGYAKGEKQLGIFRERDFWGRKKEKGSGVGSPSTSSGRKRRRSRRGERKKGHLGSTRTRKEKRDWHVEFELPLISTGREKMVQ